MFQNLQRRFLILSTVLILAVITLSMVLVCAAVSGARSRDTQQLLALILRTGGDISRAQAEQRETSQGPAGAAYDMRTSSYFLLTTSGNVITGTDLGGASGVTEEEARGIGALAIESGKESGEQSLYAYSRQADPHGGYRYAFLDVSRAKMDDIRLGTACTGAGALGAAVLIALAVWFALARLRPAQQLLEAGTDIMRKSAQGMEAGAAYLISSYKDRGSAASSPALMEGAVLSSIAADLRGVAQAAERRQKPQSIDVSALMTRLARQYHSRFNSGRLRVHESVEEGVYMAGQPDEVEAILEILFSDICENAEYGGDVFLDLLTDGSRAGIIVRCSVAELPDMEPETLFDGHESRRSPLSTGLYCARLLARLNRAELHCEYLEPLSVCFTLQFACGGPHLQRGPK